MEQVEKAPTQIDLFALLTDLLHAVKQIWVPGIILTVILSSALAFWDYKNYYPVYEAYISFTVKVANPLYSSTIGYNA